jgi:hypothetical protein
MLSPDIGTNPQSYYCVNGNKRIQLTNTLKFKLSTKRGVAVFEGKMDDQDVVVKWHQGRKTALDELHFYQWLQGKTTTAKVYSGWKLEGEDVLVMEKLISLNDKQHIDPKRIGVDILGQLKAIHKRCVHNGIKPDNIMYRPSDDKYLLIDFGSIADNPLGDGFERKSWCVGWSSQPRKVSNQSTYPDNDLYELCVVLRQLARDKKERELFNKMLRKVVRGYGRHRIRKWLKSKM